MSFKFAGESHVGCVYDHNEDAIGWSLPHNVWFVADGMGGYSKGEVASGIVKQAVIAGAADPELNLEQLVMNAHQAIVDEVAKMDDSTQMGSTLVLMMVSERHCRVIWVGDSRAYLWRDNNLQQINRDHTFLQSLVEEGVLKPEEVYNHPRKNEVLQALGMGEPEPEEAEIMLNSYDWLILCSDGLHDVVKTEDIIKVLKGCSHPSEATHKLIQASLDRGTDDNVSVIVVECPEYPPEGIKEHFTSIFRNPKKADADAV